MKAVMPEVPPFLVQWRKRTGEDRWDEMWEGVLHMPPAPNPEHQDFEGALETWLRIHWARPRRGRVYHNVNLAPEGGWPSDYRIPDLVLLTPQRLGTKRKEHFEGAPDVVVEIRSPGDETLEKMPFYARLGVAEMWIIDRDTKAPEIHLWQPGGFEQQAADSEGWVLSSATGIQLRAESGPKLAIRLAADPNTCSLLPED